MYSTQNYWVSGHFTSSGILNNYKTRRFRNWDLFPSSDEGRQTPTLLGPSEIANLSSLSLNGLKGLLLVTFLAAWFSLIFPSEVPFSRFVQVTVWPYEGLNGFPKSL
jgi:hypothetical protein